MESYWWSRIRLWSERSISFDSN